MSDKTDPRACLSGEASKGLLVHGKVKVLQVGSWVGRRVCCKFKGTPEPPKEIAKSPQFWRETQKIRSTKSVLNAGKRGITKRHAKMVEQLGPAACLEPIHPLGQAVVAKESQLEDSNL